MKTADKNVPELLSPAGDWEAMRAAVANGADAVYFGLSGFNARHRAANFTIEELPEVIEYLHGHNVRGYVTLNVLIFSDELPDVVRMVEEIARCGVDAVIVQDLGLAELIHRMFPTLAVHGSTQMTLTEPLGVEFVRDLGVSRVILARELSRTDIEQLARQSVLPMEVFVHGALCISYSGQCLTSESLGGRSANRGQCAQACRLPYQLVVDSEIRDLGDRAYLLSPQDLASYDLVDELGTLGIVSLKIEGRLKSAQYVAAATHTYRAAIDAAEKGKEFRPTRQEEMDLAQSFSRGFTHGFLDGADHQSLVHARFPKSRGISAGVVVGSTDFGILVRQSNVQLKIGDGVVFDEGHPEQDEQGGRIVAVKPHRAGIVQLEFYHGDVNPNAVAMQSTVWKTDDPEIRKRLQHSYSRDVLTRRVRLSVAVDARAGSPLRIEFRDDLGHVAQVAWDKPLEAAVKFPINRQIFGEQMGRLGETPFELGDVSVNGSTDDEFPAVMIPKSVLNDLRRQATAQLIELRQMARTHRLEQADALRLMRENVAAISAPSIVRPQLHVLARTMEQLEAALEWLPDSPGMERGFVYCEFEDIRRYPEAVAKARSAGAKIALATVRIIKPSELGLLRSLGTAAPDAILVRNLPGLRFFGREFPQIPLIADYSLNIANELTAGIIARSGAIRLTPSYDLTWNQLSSMLSKFSPAYFETVIHQQMPMFHMEHCVIAHTLSEGKDYRTCGRPCDRHRLELKDRAGVKHPLVADVGCRNTVYNGTAQSAAEFVPRMLEMGIRHFRVEFVSQSAEAAKDLLNRYARVVSRQDDGRATWRQLRVLNQLGVTRGTLE